MSITHSFVSAVADGGDTDLVRPSDWNAEHDVAGLMVLIDDDVLGGSQASFDFTSIPATYKHLRVVLSSRTDRASNPDDFFRLRFNNDSGSNYDVMWAQFFTGSGSGAFTEDIGATSMAHLGYTTAATAVADDRGAATIDIIDYANTTGLKAVLSDGYARLGTSSTNFRRWVSGGTWRSTAAIDRVTILPLNGTNFVTGSRCSLYGIS